MTSHPALRSLERLLEKDPMLRDVVAHALPRSRRTDRFIPDVEVLVAEERYIVCVDLPGIQRSEVKVRLDDGRLRVEGERKLRRPRGSQIRSTERAAGPFQREFSLPSDVDVDGVRARMAHGELQVVLPRLAGGQPVDIEVE